MRRTVYDSQQAHINSNNFTSFLKDSQTDYAELSFNCVENTRNAEATCRLT